MTKDEALKLALKFLESMMTHQWRARDIYNLKDAIKEALAQPEQEPIAWMYLEPENKFGLVHVDEYDYKQFPEEDEWIPVYKHPQPQRTWVGLTDEEIEQMGLSNYIKVVRETEAKLKEKNT